MLGFAKLCEEDPSPLALVSLSGHKFFLPARGLQVTSAGYGRTAHGDSPVSPPPRPSRNHSFTSRPIPPAPPLLFSCCPGLRAKPHDCGELVISARAELGDPGAESSTEGRGPVPDWMAGRGGWRGRRPPPGDARAVAARGREGRGE